MDRSKKRNARHVKRRQKENLTKRISTKYKRGIPAIRKTLKKKGSQSRCVEDGDRRSVLKLASFNVDGYDEAVASAIQDLIDERDFDVLIMYTNIQS